MRAGGKICKARHNVEGGPWTARDSSRWAMEMKSKIEANKNEEAPKCHLREFLLLSREFDLGAVRAEDG